MAQDLTSDALEWETQTDVTDGSVFHDFEALYIYDDDSDNGCYGPTLQDFTTFGQVQDPNNRFTISENLIDVDGLTRNEDAWVAKDMGAGHFEDFTHQFEFTAQGASGGGIGLQWAVGNALEDMNDWSANTQEAVSFFLSDDGTDAWLRNHETDGDQRWNEGINIGQKYYVTIARSGGTISADIYTDSDRTNLVQTLSISVNSGRSYRYVFGANSANNGTAADISYDVENLSFFDKPGAPFVIDNISGNTLTSKNPFAADYTVGQNGYVTSAGNGSGVSSSANAGDSTIYVADASGFFSGYDVVVADGSGWEIRTISSVDTGANTITLTSGLENDYTAAAYVTQMEGTLSVSTDAVDNIGATAADANGEITALSGDADERGFAFDTSSHGDPGNTSPGSTSYSASESESGSFGAGAFSLTMDNLLTDTMYYVRAYAHTPAEGYSYGGEVSFTTDTGTAVQLDWDASPSSDVQDYGIWVSDEVGSIDLSADPDYTTTDTEITIDVSSMSGIRCFLVRARDTSGTWEANVTQVATVQLDSGTVVSLPPEPRAVSAEAVAGPAATITWRYDDSWDGADADEARIYSNAGSGDIDWSSPVATVSLSDTGDPGSDLWTTTADEYSWTSGTLADGTYLYGVRLATAGGTETQNTDSHAVTIDDDVPTTPDLTADVV